MNEIEKLEFEIEIAEQAMKVAMDNIEIAKKKLKELNKEKENAERIKN